MKRIARLYPRRWRERYGAEIDALLERRPVTLRGLGDLVRGIVDAHMHPCLARELVFVPEIGFRPSGTRVLLERSEARHGESSVVVRSVAAAPDRTEFVIEWEDNADRGAACAVPDATGRPLPRTYSTGPHPVEGKGIVIASATPGAADEVAFVRLAVPGTASLEPVEFGPRAFMTRHSWSTHTVAFPGLPPEVTRVELRVTLHEREWRVPVTLTSRRTSATAFAVESRLNGLVVRATAAGREGDEVVVAFEVVGEDPRTILAAIGSGPPPLLPAGVKASWGAPADGLSLTDDRGGRALERRRLTHLEPPGTPLRGIRPPRRMTSSFGPIHPDATSATLSVPWVEVHELDGTVDVDLGALPTRAALGGHAFEVVRAEPSPFGPDRRRILMRALETDAPALFVRPASVRGLPPGGYAWGVEADGSTWTDTLVGDPPVVTFLGATIRVRGPWQLRIPLDG